MDAKATDSRIAELKRAAADYALARDPQARREATAAALRGLWEIAAAGGAPIEGLTIVNKLIQALEDVNRGETPALLKPDANALPERKQTGASPDLALAAALVDALNQYERMPIQEAIDYVAAKRGLRASILKSVRQRLKSKTSTDSGQAHYRAALSTISAQPDPTRAIRVQLMK